MLSMVDNQYLHLCRQVEKDKLASILGVVNHPTPHFIHFALPGVQRDVRDMQSFIKFKLNLAGSVDMKCLYVFFMPEKKT